MHTTSVLFYLLLIICALNTTHNAVYNQCILFINNDFQAEPYKLKLTLTVYFAAIFLCRCCLGFLADNCSAKKCLLISLLIAIVGHILAACSTTVDMFIVARFLQGLGLGGGQVMGLVILVKNFSHKGRATIIASEQVFFSLASVCLPLMGNLFSSKISWRMTFVAYLIFTLLVVIYLSWFQPNLKPHVNISNFTFPKGKHTVAHFQFFIPTLMSCLSISGYILWGSYFSLLVHHYAIPLKYLLMYQLIPIIPYFACSLLFRNLTSHVPKSKLYDKILYCQISAFLAIITLLLWDKTSGSFKIALFVPILLHNFAGSFFRPLMQEKALNTVSEHEIGLASSIISICQVGVNAVFAIILNCTHALVSTFVSIQCFIGGSIIAFLCYEKARHKHVQV
ncbi:MAG: MFS transporter [Puniceicoccales bacterium]|nr:MFS transporter [Puniceicoccales bacterium]